MTCISEFKINCVHEESSDLVKSLQVDFERAVKLNRIGLELMGLWPKTTRQNSREKLMCNLRVLVIFLVITTGILIPAIHSLIITHSDLMQVVDNLQVTVPIVNCAIKIVIFWWKKEGRFLTLNGFFSYSDVYIVSLI